MLSTKIVELVKNLAPNGPERRVLLDGLDLDILENLIPLVSTQAEVFSASRNRLTSIAGLVPMFCLRELVLSHNRIAEVCHVLPFPKLDLLDLSHNQITTISIQIPQSVRRVDLSFNAIQSLDNIRPVLDLPMLESLNLSANPVCALMSDFTEQVLKSVPTLRVLNDNFVVKEKDLTLSTLADRKEGPESSIIDGSNPSRLEIPPLPPAPTQTQPEDGRARSSVRSSVLRGQRGGAEMVVNEHVIVFGRATTPTPGSLDKHWTSTISQSSLTLTNRDSELRIHPKPDRTRNTHVDVHNTPQFVSEEVQTDALESLVVLKEGERVIEVESLHTLQGENKYLHDELIRLTEALRAHDDEIELLRRQNEQLKAALQPEETITYGDKQELIRASQVDELGFLRHQVAALEEILGKQEGLAALQYPIPEGVSGYMSILHSYRRRLFMLSFDNRLLRERVHGGVLHHQAAKKQEDLTATIGSLQEQLSIRDQELANVSSLVSKRDATIEELRNQLSVVNHAAEAFHKQTTDQLALISELHDSVAECIQLPDAVVEAIKKRLNINVVTHDDFSTYVVTTLGLLTAKLASSETALERTTDKIQDLLSAREILREENEALYVRVSELETDYNNACTELDALKAILQKQYLEEKRYIEIRNTGDLDFGCQVTYLLDIDTSSQGFQTDELEENQGVAIQVDELINPTQDVSCQTIAFTLEEKASSPINLSRQVIDTTKNCTMTTLTETDLTYRDLSILEDVQNRSFGVTCSIIPSSIIEKLHIQFVADDLTDETLDNALQLYVQILTQRQSRSRKTAGIQSEAPSVRYVGVQCELLAKSSPSTPSEVDSELDQSVGIQADVPAVRFVAIQTGPEEDRSHSDGRTNVVGIQCEMGPTTYRATQWLIEDFCSSPLQISRSCSPLESIIAMTIQVDESIEVQPASGIYRGVQTSIYLETIDASISALEVDLPDLVVVGIQTDPMKEPLPSPERVDSTVLAGLKGRLENANRTLNLLKTQLPAQKYREMIDELQQSVCDKDRQLEKFQLELSGLKTRYLEVLSRAQSPVREMDTSEVPPEPKTPPLQRTDIEVHGLLSSFRSSPFVATPQALNQNPITSATTTKPLLEVPIDSQDPIEASSFLNHGDGVPSNIPSTLSLLSSETIREEVGSRLIFHGAAPRTKLSTHYSIANTSDIPAEPIPKPLVELPTVFPAPLPHHRQLSNAQESKEIPNDESLRLLSEVEDPLSTRSSCDVGDGRPAAVEERFRSILSMLDA
ncbi:Leucine-rich repeat protein [Giardia muris]|uniref:Leucine-rich repeat protein n=1 Tax=Giardia muris TaxID=5742 RepID=A0A4Z1SRX4_GIAMU|nr:Leucine-rich repeat protein [Giardia muris]|eukprot:TNJ28662.1 Leucine-rich repeat protein [Giardia muris]